MADSNTTITTGNSDKLKYVGIVILIVVLIIVGYFLFSSSDDSDSEEDFDHGDTIRDDVTVYPPIPSKNTVSSYIDFLQRKQQDLLKMKANPQVFAIQGSEPMSGMAGGMNPSMDHSMMGGMGGMDHNMIGGMGGGMNGGMGGMDHGMMGMGGMDSDMIMGNPMNMGAAGEHPMQHVNPLKNPHF